MQKQDEAETKGAQDTTKSCFQKTFQFTQSYDIVPHPGPAEIEVLSLNELTVNKEEYISTVIVNEVKTSVKLNPYFQVGQTTGTKHSANLDTSLFHKFVHEISKEAKTLEASVSTWGKKAKYTVPDGKVLWEVVCNGSTTTGGIFFACRHFTYCPPYTPKTKPADENSTATICTPITYIDGLRKLFNHMANLRLDGLVDWWNYQKFNYFGGITLFNYQRKFRNWVDLLQTTHEGQNINPRYKKFLNKEQNNQFYINLQTAVKKITAKFPHDEDGCQVFIHILDLLAHVNRTGMNCNGNAWDSISHCASEILNAAK